jgi:hypothetical protein
MTTTIWRHGFSTAIAIAALVALAAAPAIAQPADKTLQIGNKDIGGVVSGPGGPEAGAWVIAETTNLPTKFAKVVVTDDQGRYLIPDLPSGTYRVWARGYGLVDSKPLQSVPGKRVDLTAVPAPTPAAAAEYYPGVYWYSMLKVPATSEFPGTGDKGNGISEAMKTQAYWIDSIKNSCQSCHALGDQGIRHIPAAFTTESRDSTEAWERRTQAGQAMTNMALTLGRLGPHKALTLFADWTDRIAAGELPFAKPERPQGVERNVVISMWDWGSAKSYLHDAISTDKRTPTVNANGLIYGSPEESTDFVPTLDPVHNRASRVKHPYLDPKTPSSLDLPKGTSAYWGDELIWDGHTSIHNPIMDERGRVWFTARIRPAADPAFCADHPSAKFAPLKESVRQLSMFDPKTNKWSLIDTCFTTQHLYFAKDANNTLWTSAGGPQSGVVGWLNTKLYEATGDQVKSQGWTPLIIDTNGNGKRDAWVEADQPLDPTKDKRIMAAFYGVQPSPVDDSIWGQSMDVGFSRMEQPGYIIRLVPGPNPAETSLAEVYLPPDEGYGSRGLDLDSNGVVWTVLSSGHMASFDRRKCKGPLNGPTTATGKQCPEGWTLYRFPGPQFKGVTDQGAAEHAYYVWVDRDNTLGLGPNVPIASTNGGESLLAIVDGKFVNLRIPYPMGFFSKNVDGRIDDPNAGWKGRGLWTTSGTRTNFHGEGGKGALPKLFKVQVRPDPLAG